MAEPNPQDATIGCLVFLGLLLIPVIALVQPWLLLPLLLLGLAGLVLVGICWRPSEWCNSPGTPTPA